MSEQASAWKQWQQSPCWNELLSMVDDIKAKSVRDEDSVPIDCINVAVVGHERGIRTGLNRLLRRIGDITEQ